MVFALDAPRDSCEQGTVVARFVVEKDGTPSHIEIVRSPSDALSREVMRVIGTSQCYRMGVSLLRILFHLLNGVLRTSSRDNPNWPPRTTAR